MLSLALALALALTLSQALFLALALALALALSLPRCRAVEEAGYAAAVVAAVHEPAVEYPTARAGADGRARLPALRRARALLLPLP